MRARNILFNFGKVGATTVLGLAAVAFSAQLSLAQGSIDIGNGSGAPGGVAAVEVSLNGTGDQTIVAITNDIGFDASNPVAANEGGTPDCTLNSSIMKGNTSFAFRPRNCTVGTDCTGIRATVISFNPAESDTDIPDGLVYTCNVSVPADAEVGSTILLENQIAGITNVDREDIDVTEASADGSVEVVPPATSTPTPTDTPAVTATSTNTATPESTATNTPRPTKAGGDDDDGCQMVAPANTNSGWLLLLPAAVLIWRRRRAR